MAFQSVNIPESIKSLSHHGGAESLIDTANDRIEAFMLADEEVIENFVTCDFHLVDLALQWIQENHLMAGNRFCELGSGFGVAAMLAANRKMESYGIEIESVLVDQSNDLAKDLGNSATFFCGSFIPRGIPDFQDLAAEIQHVDTHEDDVFDEIGRQMNDFDLFFAFPWPGEHTFFESVVDAFASSGTLLLTYRGREGMDLKRKI